MATDPDLSKELKKADLRYVDYTIGGISRLKVGKTFNYYDSKGKKIRKKATKKRIESLAIPPAWKDVWVCSSPNGYLQAVGQDDRGRKQYIYHPDWIKRTQENKFNKILFFAKALPEIRNQISKDIAKDDLTREKIIATVIWLLEHTLIRIGNSEYAQENDSYGLTTLRNRHVAVRGKNIKFEFRGKSGVEQSISIDHPKIAKIIKECIELPGYEIFKYFDDSGERHIVNSEDVNQYLKNLTGEDITAKDFRTWGGTVYAATTLKSLGFPQVATQIKKNISEAVIKVSQHLHNTKAVCRTYYIHPTVFDTYQKDILIPHFENIYKNFDRERAKLAREEFATLTLLKRYS